MRHIIPLGPTAEVLRQRSRSVKRIEEADAIIRDLKETWPTVQALGIAAPQIGSSKRLFIFRHDREGTEWPEVLLNPKVVRVQGSCDDYEGCLSIAHVYGHCIRASHIEITAWDEAGRRVRRTFDGYDARIIQHEMDHLDGVLYIDRIDDWDSLRQWVPNPDGLDDFKAVTLQPTVVASLRALARPLPGYALTW